MEVGLVEVGLVEVGLVEAGHVEVGLVEAVFPQTTGTDPENTVEGLL